MKIVVVSDSHTLTEPLDMVLRKHKDADCFLHCGDICLDPALYPQFTIVSGNNDYYDLPLEKIIDLPNTSHRLIMFHSHLFPYFKKEKHMVKRAKADNCDIVCYGHTHCAFYEVIDGVHVINPGSLYHARDGRNPSYAIIQIINDKVSVEFTFLNE